MLLACFLVLLRRVLVGCCRVCRMGYGVLWMERRAFHVKLLPQFAPRVDRDYNAPVEVTVVLFQMALKLAL